jgi:glycerol-3-phosphate acyltransferase PlsY
MTTANQIGILTGCYALGCLNAGYYLTRLRTGRDIRTLGSGNAGAANVGRVLGKLGFVATFLLDFGKGAAAMLLARSMNLPHALIGLAMICCVAGHIWPIQLGFRGGKGLATAVGTLAFYCPQLLAVQVCVFLCAYLLTRRYILGAIAAIALAPLATAIGRFGQDRVLTVGVAALLVLYAHRANIRNEFTNRKPVPPESRLP